MHIVCDISYACVSWSPPIDVPIPGFAVSEYLQIFDKSYSTSVEKSDTNCQQLLFSRDTLWCHVSHFVPTPVWSSH